MVRDMYNPTNYFNVEQPNPTEGIRKSRKSDCVIRALAIAAGITWIESFDLLCDCARKVYEIPNAPGTYEQVFKELGYKADGFGRTKKGTKRITAKQFALSHKKGTYILSLANHLTCVKDGKIRDAWNCGDKCVYKYWVVKEPEK